MTWLALGLQATFLLVAFAHPALRHRGTGRPTRATDDTPRPVSWHVADAMFVLAWILLALCAVLAEDEGPVAVRAVSGVVPVAVGVGLLIWAQRTMGLAWRPDIPPVRDGSLATRGPFAIVRNPNYVAMLIAALGVAVVSGGPVAVAALVMLLASLALTARAEEPLLLARYGAAYEQYAARVGRFVPGVGRIIRPAEADAPGS